MEIYFNNDIFHEIAKHLPVGAVINLAKMLPWVMMKPEILKEYWLRQATERLCEQLYKIGWTDELIDSLKKTNSYIAGSFPLQCLLGEFWEGSDIDIFAPDHGTLPPEDRYRNDIVGSFHPNKYEALAFCGFSKTAKRYCILCDQETKNVGSCHHLFSIDTMVEKDLGDQVILHMQDKRISDVSINMRILFRASDCVQSCDQKYKSVVTNYIEQLLIKHFPAYTDLIKKSVCAFPERFPIWQEWRNYADYNAPNISSVNSYLFRDRKVQIISLEKIDPVNFIKGFDLDFCKVYFDGETLQVANWDSVLTRSSVVNGERKIRRIEKYQERGFTII